MSEPVKIAIVIRGGMVQSVGTFGVPVDAVIIDYDCEDADPDCVSIIPIGACGEVVEDGDAVIVTWHATPLSPEEVSFLEANS
jgi:hypothetical protein